MDAERQVANTLVFNDPNPLPLVMGDQLSEFTLAYETWGELNKDRSNAVLLFTGLSASSHARSHPGNTAPGWWEGMIGSGSGLDTDRWFVICVNHLGGCFGSTGPSSLRPNSNRRYGPDFPPLTIRDLAHAANRMIRSLGIDRLHGVLGASQGGMLSLEYAACFPDQVDRLISISATGRTGPQSIAYRYVQRQVILNDPAYQGGWYYDTDQKPVGSMAVARQIGNITYRSRQEWEDRFGRGRTGSGYSYGPDFQVESYLHHMGHKLAHQFDANSFLLLTKAMDLFSLGYGFNSYREGVARIKSPSLIMGVGTDMLFPVDEQEAVYLALKNEGNDTQFRQLNANSGHDSFLVEVEYFGTAIQDFLRR
ncbi:MAG: homoserine O-acetyltransferase [Acidobacteria bacterium]|nr:homoserine O-acetyltransferase [Acidobacteriota bacterium]